MSNEFSCLPKTKAVLERSRLTIFCLLKAEKKRNCTAKCAKGSSSGGGGGAANVQGQHSGDATGARAFLPSALAYFKGDQSVCGRAGLDIPAVGAAERRRRYNKPASGTLSARMLLLRHLFGDVIGCKIEKVDGLHQVISSLCLHRSDSQHLRNAAANFFG